MATTAGALSLVSKGSTTASLSSAAATGGTAPYTYQWYRSTTSGFSPGPSNVVSGATALTLDDTGLLPNTTYYYVVKATDSSSPAVADDSAELAVTTDVVVPSQNQFSQSPILGMVDMPYNYNTMAAEIDVSASTDVYYAGQGVKVVANTAGGIMRVIACDADSDACIGFINFDIKSRNYQAGDRCQISMSGNVIWLYAAEAITQGTRVTLNAVTPGSVNEAGHTSQTVVGWALDGAAASGALIRVFLLTPSFATA